MHPQGNNPATTDIVEHSTDPYYSNEDVEILHNIVVLAEELLPSLPERERLPTNALFNAYYDILPRVGIDADHDSRYARILFKIGGLRGQGTLYEKFEEVLSRMGIEIEFDSDAVEEDDGQLEYSRSQQNDFATGDASLPNREGDSYRRARRNSESSAWDLTHQTPTAPRTRRNSFSSVGPIKISSEFEERLPSRHVSCQGLAVNGVGPHNHKVFPEEGPFQHKEPGASMQDEASRFYQHNLQRYAKLQLRRWKVKALQAQERTFHLQQMATQHDTKALLHSAYDAWRSTFLERCQIAETERYYEELEQRAEKARNLYLLDRAFSHWSSFAHEQVQRTARARQHIVKNRIFSAWKHVATGDELKARKQVLKKFIGAWKQRSSVIAQANAAAVQRYESNLVEKKYREWSHSLWDMKATNWYAERLAHRALTHWLAKSRSNWEEDRMAQEKRSAEHATNLWQLWREKTEIRVRKSEQAEKHYKLTLCRTVFRKWRREAKMVPASEALQTKVSTRLLREAFGLWHKRANIEKQAAAVDRAKILREALTVWRHKQRSQELTSRIDTRVLKQSMLTWVRVARDKRAQQSLKDELLRRVMRTWKDKQQASTERRQERENMAQSFAASRAQNLVLRQWYSRMEIQQRNETAAVDFYAPRLVRGSLTEWSNKLQHVRKLEQRSRDAQYYFLASKTLKLWKAATEAAKREKRKGAYIQVRRNAKINLARKILKTWQGKAKPIIELQNQASNIYHNNQIVLAVEIFDRWRGRAEELSKLESLAREKVLKKQYTAWKDRLVAQQALDTEATIVYQEQQQSRALKKWSLTALQLRAQANYAREIREKNTKRNFRKMFLYWHQKAVQNGPSNTEFSKSVHFETTSTTELSSEIEEESRDPEVVGHSTPGYLSTPSKRLERRHASTTPKVPLSTPFERRLRAQWSGGMRTPFRTIE